MPLPAPRTAGLGAPALPASQRIGAPPEQACWEGGGHCLYSMDGAHPHLCHVHLNVHGVHLKLEFNRTSQFNELFAGYQGQKRKSVVPATCGKMFSISGR